MDQDRITKLTNAIKFVAEDQKDIREPGDTDMDLVNYARNVLHVKGVQDGPPNWEVSPDEGSPETYEAYSTVLLATADELDEVFGMSPMRTRLVSADPIK